MSLPLVSIIIPLFNAGNYIAETIKSALEQTYAYKEIIIVDDGSTDNSLYVAKSFESEIVRVYSQANKGASAARNRGMAEAKGNYVQFLDADDLLSPDKIEKQINALNKYSNKIAVCSTIHFVNETSDAKPSSYEESFLFDDNDSIHFLTSLLGGYSNNSSMVSIHSWLTPKHIIDKAGPWNENLTVDDDGEFFCRVLLNSKGVTKTGGYNYYRKSSSPTLSTLKDEKSFQSAVNALDLIKQHLEPYLTPHLLYKCFYKSYKNYGVKCYPNYQNISQYCFNKAKEILDFANVKDDAPVILGGEAINFIANKISWKLARNMQCLIRQK